MNKICPICSKTIPEYHNYCSNWDCVIELTKRAGGVAYQPNGLPIRSIRHDNMMLEHEHGDHPDYKFPVEIQFEGEKVDPSECDAYANETHALIYTDGSIAVTIYECCYAIWQVSNRELIGGKLWPDKGWHLTEESRDKILEYHEKKIS